MIITASAIDCRTRTCLTSKERISETSLGRRFAGLVVYGVGLGCIEDTIHIECRVSWSEVNGFISTVEEVRPIKQYRGWMLDSVRDRTIADLPDVWCQSCTAVINAPYASRLNLPCVALQCTTLVQSQITRDTLCFACRCELESVEWGRAVLLRPGMHEASAEKA